MTARILVAALWMSACVPKGRHELVEVQLEATRAAFGAQQAAAQEQIRTLEQATVDQSVQLQRNQTALEEAREATTLAKEELAAVLAEKAAWLAQPPPPPPPGKRPPPIDPSAPQTVPSVAALERILADQAQARMQRNREVERHAEVLDAFAPLVEADRVTVVGTAEGTVVRIPIATLFQEGKVLLSPLGDAVLDGVAAALAKVPGRSLRIVGHTDDRPHHSVEHPSNWELGFHRAVVVLRDLEARGVPNATTAASCADTDPVVDPATPGAGDVNARVELVLSQSLPPEPPATAAPPTSPAPVAPTPDGP